MAAPPRDAPSRRAVGHVRHSVAAATQQRSHSREARRSERSALETIPMSFPDERRDVSLSSVPAAPRAPRFRYQILDQTANERPKASIPAQVPSARSRQASMRPSPGSSAELIRINMAQVDGD